MVDTYQKICINFLPIRNDIPSFLIYRKLRENEQEPRPEGIEVRAYRLPESSTEGAWYNYWVSLEAIEGFEQFQVAPNMNHHLTRWALFKGLYRKISQSIAKSNYSIRSKGFISEIRLHMASHKEGIEELILQPYFLHSMRKFGFLADFHFRRDKNQPFNRIVQKLSLSLDKNFKRNLNYYQDRVSKIQEFLGKEWDILSSFTLIDTNVKVYLDKNFELLAFNRLNSRVYIVGNEQESKSPFIGIQRFGPLQKPSGIIWLLFVFREQNRPAARTLAKALQGIQRPSSLSFHGFESLFKTKLEIDHNPEVITDFSEETMQRILKRIEISGDKLWVPIFILDDNDKDAYLTHKALFIDKGIISQACRLSTIQNENSLKWSVANIALQIFCKVGGQPWKVRPTSERCLIIGISQSHKIKKSEQGNQIEKYYAFCVLTDNSGLFQEIQVLGESKEKATYLDQVRDRLRDVLSKQSEVFTRVVIHTSFKLKHHEIAEIHKIVEEVAKSKKGQCQFAVIKINQQNRFFGFNQCVNSLVPYEGTYVNLGHGEYLVWFEGIFPDNPTVRKVFPGPIHLQFLKINESDNIPHSDLLQDLMNLSGANWRGFNAKNSPVSVLYCHLIANFLRDFQEKSLHLPSTKDIRPWFL
ncbi:MAG: piwi domain protein [Firmicutes bacterium]|nr:piwi domain protein [Bacillota bacterium]